MIPRLVTTSPPLPLWQARSETLAAAAAKRRYLDLARALQAGDAYADVSPAALRAELARTKEALAAALGQPLLGGPQTSPPLPLGALAGDSAAAE